MAVQENNIRKNNVGTSDYSKHKIQPWDIWEEYHLNPWDADIVKRVLRTKVDNTRRMDYEKIIHDCQKCIELIDKGSFIYDNILDKEANYKRLHPTLTEEEYKVLEDFRNHKNNKVNNNTVSKYKVGLVFDAPYKVGDEVFIKDLLWYNNNKDDKGNIYIFKDSNKDYCGSIIFTKSMATYCDKKAIITEVNTNNNITTYKLDIDNGANCWIDEMLVM